MKRNFFSFLLSILLVAGLLVVAVSCGDGGGGGSISGAVSNPLPQPNVDCGGETCIE